MRHSYNPEKSRLRKSLFQASWVQHMVTCRNGSLCLTVNRGLTKSVLCKQCNSYWQPGSNFIVFPVSRNLRSSLPALEMWVLSLWPWAPWWAVFHPRFLWRWTEPLGSCLKGWYGSAALLIGPKTSNWQQMWKSWTGFLRMTSWVRGPSLCRQQPGLSFLLLFLFL